MLQTTDANLAKAGYTYTVNGFSSLTDAVAAMATYDNTDNDADATVDGTPQLFNVVYTANNQSIPVKVVGLPAAKVPNLANLTGVTDSTYNNVPTDAQLKVPGYAYVITDSNNKAVTLDQLKTATFQMNGEQLAVTDYTVTYTAEPTSAKVIYQYDSSATLANAPTLPAPTVITGVTDGAYPATTIQTLPGYTTVVVAQSAQVTGQYDAATNQINGTFTADDMSGDNSVYVVTYVPTDHDIKVHYEVDEPTDATEPSGTFTLPADTKISIKTDKGYQITSVATPGYAIEKIDGKVIDWDKLDKVTETAEDGKIITYYKLDDHTLISSDKLNVTFTNTAAVDATGELQTSLYDITLLPTKQDFDVTYEWADAATQDAANATAKAKIDAQVAAPVAKTGIYTDHKYGFSYVVVPGYTATVSGVAHVDEKTDSDLTGAFEDDGKGNVTANMHAVNTSYKVVYSANKQHIDVVYHVADTGMTDVLAVTGLPTDDSGILTGSLEGQTDMAYTDETSGDFNYKLVKAVPGYTYTITDAAGHVVKDATGKLLFMREADFDLSTLPGTFAVDATTGALIQNQYTITYQADKQQQQITFENPTDSATGKAPVTDPITQTADSNQTFAEVDLGKDYNIPGYTMHIDGEAGAVLASQKADNTDVAYTFDNDATDEALAQSVAATDGTVQKHVVTYVANTDQKASLTIVNKPVSAGDLPIVAPITDGTTDAKVDFGITQSQLYVPGYTFVVTLVGDDAKTPVNIDDLRFTRDESDAQAYEVTYTPISQTVNVNYKTDGLTTAQQANVPGSAADFTLTGNTDTNYASATVSGASNAVISGRPGYTFTVSEVHGQGSDATSSAISAATNLGSQATFDLADAANGYTFAVSGTGNESGLAVAGSEQLKTPEIDVAYTALPQHMQVTYAVAGTATTAQQARVDAGAKDNPTTFTATTDALLSVATAATTMIIHSIDGYTFMIYKKKADGSRGDLVTTDPQTTDFDLTKNALTKDQLFAVDADGNLVMPGYDVVYTPDVQKAVIVSATDPAGKLSENVDHATDNVIATGISDADIVFTETDADLARAGYTYTVMVGNQTYDTLANAVQAASTYDTTNNLGDADATPQLFTVVYAPIAQTVNVTYNTDNLTAEQKTTVNAKDSTLDGVTDANYRDATKGATVPAVPGYTFTITDAKDTVVVNNASESFDLTSAAGTFAVGEDGKLKNDHFTVVYTPVAQSVAVDYDTSNLTATQNVTVDAKNGKLDGVTDAKYSTATGDKIVKAVPGYTFTITDASDKPVVSDATKSFDLTTVDGLFALNGDGQLANDHFKVVYTPVVQTVQVNYDTTKLNATQKSQVNAPATATVTGVTDALNETAKGDTTVPAKAGYTFTVTDAKGNKIVENSEKNFDLTTVAGQFAVDEDGNLKNPSYTVVYTPETQTQTQTIDVTFPTSANRKDETGTVVNTTKTGEDFTETDLSKYNVDGYTMYVDDVKTTSIASEATDTTANGLSEVDGKPQNHKVTYVANKDQKATLTFANDPKHRDKISETNGVSDATVNFGTTTADLAVPGYSYVIKDAVGNEYKSIDDFIYTAAEADSQDYTVTYTALPVTVAVHYDTTKLTTEQQTTVNAKDGNITGATDAGYATAEGATVVPAVPGYTFTVTDKAGNKVVEDSKNAYDLTQATGTFAVDKDGKPVNNQFTVVYTPVKQTVAVDYDTSNLNETQTSQVKAPATATITGKTDALNATADGDTTVKAVPGYTFTVTDASGKLVVENSEKNFDLTKVPGQFAVNANGLLKNPSYNVVYTPELQQQTVNVTFPASANRANETGTVVNKSVTGQDFTVTDLSSYNVDGYTMLVDGTPATSIVAEATDTTANGLNKTDSKPQLHTVTFVANTDQKARLTFVNDPKQRDQITKNDGESDTTINFGTTTADLAVPGYSYVITDAAGNTYKSIDDFVYTAKEADLQDYTVTYTADPVTVAVHFDTTMLTKEQQATVNVTDGEISGKTDADYMTAQGQTTVPAVPGYTFTVTNAAGEAVAQDATSDFDLTTVSGAFTVNPDGTPKNDHFTVVYTPVEQVVTVNTDTTGLNATQKTQVNVPATATITGKTDALNTTATGATTVKAVPGYTFTVTDAAGHKMVENSEANFDLTTVPGQFAVNPDGTLQNPNYTVVYTPEVQQQTVNVTCPTSANRANETGTVVNTTVTGQDFTATDLSNYNVDGYTMLVDGVKTTMINPEATDTTANGTSATDGAPQVHNVTFVANTDQQATLTFVNDPKHRQPIVETTGTSDTTISFGTKTVDLAVPGYSYVITDAAGKTYTSIDEFVYTAKEADSQDYTVTYTPAVQQQTVTVTFPKAAGRPNIVGQVTQTSTTGVDFATVDLTKYAVPGYTMLVDGRPATSIAPEATDTTPNGLATVDNAPQGHHVTFVANAAKAQIVVIDDTTGATLRVDDVQGVTDGEVVYNSPATIKRYEAMGYVLVSDGFIAGTHYYAIADATRDSQVFEIHLKHDTVDGTGKMQTIVRHTTIKTPDGKVVTVEQVVTVTPHFSVDRVTGERVPDAAVTDKTKYAHAEMPWLETRNRTARTVVSEIKINGQTGETDFGDVQVANVPGYKLGRTNEPNGDQVVTFVATATAPVTPHESVKASMTTESTPTVVTVLQPTPSVPVVTSAAPALVSQAPASQAVITSASAVNVTPTTSAPLAPIMAPDVAVIHDTVVDEGLWIHEIPDDKDGDVSDLQNLHDTNVMMNDPYFVALLFATLVAAGMFGVLMAFYRRREATERKLAARRDDGD
ncbi:mucin-binding protein [Weissella cibaria]|uniref:mucin-binding protein n=1 Tax=Weissella cibaria TaxID=137591 RepID=UPI0005B8AF39|nr:hypothetical protein [Weissella cibaria]